MKKYASLFVVLGILTACSLIKSQTDTINEELETNNTQDVVKCVELFVAPETVSPAYKKCIAPCGNGYNDKCKNKCKTPFLEQNVKPECIYENDISHYNSDKCILHRRNLHESKVNYFDYKRFLPQDTFVDTDEKFLQMTEFYKNKQEELKKCVNDGQEKTSQEISDCRTNLLAPLYKFERAGIQPCNSIVQETYKAELQKTIKWYKWATNHDPYEQINTLRNLERQSGLPTGWQYIYPDPVLSKSEAKSEMQKRIQDFGKEHLCSTDSFKSDLQKLGFKF